MMQSNYVNVNGLRLHYWRSGGLAGGAVGANKPQLLLLHGLTDAGACWTPVIEALQADYDIIAPDARGHGLSEGPAMGYTPADHASDAAALIQTLKLNKPVVAGHSMGGMQSTVLAARHSDLMRAVIFEDPAWFAPGTQSAQAAQQQMLDWVQRLREEQAKPKAELIAQGHQRNPSWSQAELNPWADAKRQTRIQVLDYILAQSADWCDLLKAIRVPVLLITGDVSKGVIITPEMVREAQAAQPQLTVANIPGAGHSIRRENFSAFMVALKAFLARVSA